MRREYADAARQVGSVGALGLTLVLSTALGLAAGNWLDRRFPVVHPLGTLGGFLLGVVTGFWNIYVVLYGRPGSRPTAPESAPPDDTRQS
jgi:F0F1-type ATP synthase assembly protein I